MDDSTPPTPAPTLTRQQRRAREREMAKRRERAVTYDQSNPAYIDRGDGSPVITLPYFTSLGPLGVEQCVRANGWAGPVEKAKYRREMTERVRGVFG